MKNYIIICIVFLIALISACEQQKIKKIELPEKADVIKVNYTVVDECTTIVSKEKIHNLFLELTNVNNYTLESYQDTPQVSSYAEISFETSTGISSMILYIYQSGEEFFAEQPYNGIFLIDKKQYQTIIDIFFE